MTASYLRWCCACLMVMGNVCAGAAPAVDLSLEAGSAHVVRLEGITQVAVGNSQLVQANAVSANEVILFAKQPGSTTVDIWAKGGTQTQYRVVIESAGLQRRLQEVSKVLEALPGVGVRLAGQHIVVEGREVSTENLQQLKQILSRYPDVVDLTSSIAWDEMVMLDVKVLELPRHEMREMGVHWEMAPQGGLHAASAWQIGSAGLVPTQRGPLEGSGQGGLLGMNELINARLQTLMQQGQAVLLAQPQLLARSGSAASFQAGGEIPYAYVDKDGKRTTLFKKYGVLLNVTPEIDPQGAIRAQIEIEVSSIDPSITTDAGPAIRMRKAKSEFNVKSGQTLVLGGFLSHEQVAGTRGLFGVQHKQLREVELAIFVTPVVVTPDHPSMMARVTRAQTIEDWQIGQSHEINVPMVGQPDDQTHQWHPAHDTLSQWSSRARSGQGNTHSFDPIKP